MFDRFHRVDAARSRASGGSGLGLAICRSIVEAHGGTITVASAVNRGSRFTVTLPRRNETVERFRELQDRPGRANPALLSTADPQ